MNPMEKYLGKGGGDKEPLVEDESSDNSSGAISFSVPPGFKIPDGVKDGEPFDAMATLKMENGKLTLHELDGTPVADEPEEGEQGDESEGEDQNSEPKDNEVKDHPMPTEDEEDSSDEKGLGFLDAIEKKASKRK